MQKIKVLIFTLGVSLVASSSSFAQRVEISDNPETVEVNADQAQAAKPVRGERYPNPPATGKKAAQKYFKKDDSDTKNATTQPVGSDEHYLMLGIGAFIDSDAYNWGNNHATNPGNFNLDVTYRFGEWVNSMDFLLRIDYQSFDLKEDKDPRKLSFLPLITFPDAGSRFPLYFGAGAGLGVFFSQIDGKSSLSLDYQLLVGARFFNIVDTTGFFIETGLKNHLLLLSSGQFNGIFLNVGTVHTF